MLLCWLKFDSQGYSPRMAVLFHQSEVFLFRNDTRKVIQPGNYRIIIIYRALVIRSRCVVDTSLDPWLVKLVITVGGRVEEFYPRCITCAHLQSVTAKRISCKYACPKAKLRIAGSAPIPVTIIDVADYLTIHKMAVDHNMR